MPLLIELLTHELATSFRKSTKISQKTGYQIQRKTLQYKVFNY